MSDEETSDDRALEVADLMLRAINSLPDIGGIVQHAEMWPGLGGEPGVILRTVKGRSYFLRVEED